MDGVAGLQWYNLLRTIYRLPARTIPRAVHRNPALNTHPDTFILVPMSDISDLDNLFEDVLKQTVGEEDAPDFSDLFSEDSSQDTSTKPGTTFKKIETVLGEPRPVFTQTYYQDLLTGEGDISKRVHQLLGAFLKATDPQDRSVHRGRLVPGVWDLYRSIAGKVSTRQFPEPKKMLLRFAILLPTAISPEQRKLISQIPDKNTSGEPIFYQDEWLKEVSYGRVTPSATDETKTPSKNQVRQINAQLEKARGRFEAQTQLLQNLTEEIKAHEGSLMDSARRITYHDSLPGHDAIIQPYTEPQRASFSEINSLLRQLSNLNRKLGIAQNEFISIQEQLAVLEEQEGDDSAQATADAKASEEEMNTLRQMAKLCVGRQGNHFPILYKQYYHGSIRDTGTREQVLNTIAEVEHLDPGLFLRTFKQQTNRIVPNIILIPCYGDYGICWEPFERFNRATSRGRLAIPMYPKDLRTAVIAALGDLRWQVAKEKAQHYWMEEGLTGWYYQWFSDNKLKGDVKDQFIQDYILWISKESEGTQKLARETRDIFWRYMPFPQEVRDVLKNRGFVYAELAKKDMNRSMSDGY